MLNIIRNKLASMIAVKAADTPATRAADMAADTAETNRRRDIHLAQVSDKPVHQEPIVGSVTTEDILNFSSKYARNAVVQLGAWSAIARGFSAFTKNPKADDLDGLCLEFHAWNAVAESPIGDEDSLATIAKLSVVKPAKGSQETDAIIARVLKKSIEEVRADRQQKAALATKKREDSILGFNTLLWSTVYSDGTYSLPAQKVLDKLEQTLLWMAGWDTTNPAALAAELLLVEADIKMVKAIAKQEAGATHDFEDGVMCADTLPRLSA